MEEALNAYYDANLMADYQRLKNYGATSINDFLQFEKMQKSNKTAEEIAKSVKPRVKSDGEWMYGSGYAANDFQTYDVESAKKINGLRKNMYGGWYNNTTNLPK